MAKKRFRDAVGVCISLYIVRKGADLTVRWCRDAESQDPTAHCMAWCRDAVGARISLHIVSTEYGVGMLWEAGSHCIWYVWVHGHCGSKDLTVYGMCG